MEDIGVVPPLVEMVKLIEITDVARGMYPADSIGALLPFDFDEVGDMALVMLDTDQRRRGAWRFHPHVNTLIT
eukprot:13900709-Alexandrium_andersonii.AAC.1